MFFQKFCDKFNIKLHLILQPCLYVTKKIFQLMKREDLMNGILYQTENLTLKIFIKKIDHLLSKFRFLL